jgi:hypothetical protein
VISIADDHWPDEPVGDSNRRRWDHRDEVGNRDEKTKALASGAEEERLRDEPSNVPTRSGQIDTSGSLFQGLTPRSGSDPEVGEQFPDKWYDMFNSDSQAFYRVAGQRNQNHGMCSGFEEGHQRASDLGWIRRDSLPPDRGVRIADDVVDNADMNGSQDRDSMIGASI